MMAPPTTPDEAPPAATTGVASESPVCATLIPTAGNTNRRPAPGSGGSLPVPADRLWICLRGLSTGPGRRHGP